MLSLGLDQHCNYQVPPNSGERGQTLLGFHTEQLQNVLQRQAGRQAGRQDKLRSVCVCVCVCKFYTCACSNVCVCVCVCANSTHVPVVKGGNNTDHGGGVGQRERREEGREEGRGKGCCRH